ncbi:hypothetical protein BJY04DRAFT_220397 [Aspergillus karnatakaensis]|uniref:WD40 repeat domain-containing protein n=1 Tax=Aspergillus karnatakaensis TaxID=1810916 RepID=UPI003CCD2976
MDPTDIHHVYDDSNFEAPDGITPLGEAAKAGHVNIMTILMDAGHPERRIAGSVVNMTAANRDSGQHAMQLLLERPGTVVEITKKALFDAAANPGCGAGIIGAIVRHRADQISVTKGVFMRAAKNLACGQEVARLLLAHIKLPMPMDPELVPFVMRWFDSACIRLLLERAGREIVISTDTLLAAARNQNAVQAVSLLLAYDTKRIPIMEEVWESIVHTRHHRMGLVRLLLEYESGRFTLTGKLAMAAAALGWDDHNQLMAAMMTAQHTYEITDHAAETIVRWFNTTVMEQLLEHPRYQAHNIDALLTAASRNQDPAHRERLLELFANVTHRGNVSTSPKIGARDVRCAVAQLKVLLGHNDEVWASAFSHDGATLVTGSRDGVLVLYDTSGFTITQAIDDAHKGGITCLAWNLGDTFLVTGSNDKTVRVRETKGYTGLCEVSYRNPIVAVIWMNDGASFIFIAGSS